MLWLTHIIFYFHMAGNGIGTLNVYQVTISDQYFLLLNLTGDQGNYWQREELLLHAEEDFVVMFEGQAGKGVKPLISVDDILFTRECLLASSSGPTEPTSLPPSDPSTIDEFVALVERQLAAEDLARQPSTNPGWKQRSSPRLGKAEGFKRVEDRSQAVKGPYRDNDFGSGYQGNSGVYRYDHSNYRCYKCQKLGHIAKNCTESEEPMQCNVNDNFSNVIVSNHSPFRVAFAAEVGGDSLTDIALDDISFTPECEVGGPITPQPPTCSPDSFQCQYVYECIPLTWLCDWEPDCVDESDESNCPTKNPGTLPPQDRCGESQFQCSNEQYLPSLLRCDGVAVCPVLKMNLAVVSCLIVSIQAQQNTSVVFQR
ncbi:UNVERIFIED_CONTAM: hypothetical protein FKN15_057003 [Acipenser sinensis]